MSEAVSENPQRIFLEFIDLCAQLAAIESELKQDSEKTRDLMKSIKQAVLQELGIQQSPHPTESTPGFHELYKEKRSRIEVSNKRIELVHKRNDLRTRQQAAAAEFAKILPTISSEKLKKGHIYRGALARNLLLRPPFTSTDDGFYIENMAFDLNTQTSGNAVNFTGVYNQECALAFARNGASFDSRSREDAIIIEVPFALIANNPFISDDSSKYYINPNFLMNRRTKIYRPEV